MKKLLLLSLCLVFLLCLAGVSSATNGYQLTGIGQLQNSMGGAVTAAPMDAMTAVTNPAGMARIGKRADFSMEGFMPTRTVDFTSQSLGGDSTEGGSEMYGIPSLGWVAPAFGKEDVFFGGGMFATSGLGVDYGQVVFMPGAGLDMMSGAPSGTFKDVTFDGYSAIQFWKMAPTVAWNVDEKLSLGVAANLSYQSVTVRQAIRSVPFWNDPSNPSAGITQRDVKLDLGRPTNQFGVGASIGAIYDINEMVAVGASYMSKQIHPHGEYRVGEGDVQNFNGAVGLAGIYEMDLDFPQQFALGVAVKPIEPLLVAFDLKWLNWSDTHDKVDFTGPAGAFDTNGDGVGDSNSTTLDFGWDDQWVYALGLQYKATKELSVRTGFNYGKSPIEEADVFNNLVFPAIVEKHFSLGFDYMLGKHWGVAMNYMKAFKESMEGKGDVPQGFQQATPFTADSGAKVSLEEDSIGLQLTYLF